MSWPCVVPYAATGSPARWRYRTNPNSPVCVKAVGPSAGVIILSSSQKPSGVGAGDVARPFNRYRDNHDVRAALKCGNRVVSEAILGGDAYAEGFDASTLPTGPEYLGVVMTLCQEKRGVQLNLAYHGNRAMRRARQVIGRGPPGGSWARGEPRRT